MVVGERERSQVDADTPVESRDAAPRTSSAAFTVKSFSWRGLRARPMPLVTTPLAIFALTRLGLYLAALYGSRATGVGSLSTQLSGWDGQHYLDIVSHGYPTHPDASHFSTIAFFPVYPLVVRFVKTVVGLTPLGAAVVVSLLAGAGVIVTVTKLVASAFDPASGKRAGILMAVFPGSFIVSLPYAEALAVLFVVSCLWANRRGHPYWGGVLGGLATATSPLMITIFPALLWRAWRTKDRRAMAASFLTPLGFVAYMAYLWRHTGRPATWFQEQWTALDHHFDVLAPIHWLHLWPGVGLIETLSLLVFAAGVYALWRVRAPSEWSIFAILMVAVAVFDSALWANPRLLFNAFPIVLALAVWLRRDAFRVAMCACAILLPIVYLLYMTVGAVTGQP
jgi:Mannosyltransferase (PIG-V)